MSVTGFLSDLVKSTYQDESGVIYVRLVSAGTEEGSTPYKFVPERMKDAMTTNRDGLTAIRATSV